MNRYQTSLLLNRLEYASCHGKKAYFSQRQADDKAEKSSAFSGEELIGYRCDFCLLWHMGIARVTGDWRRESRLERRAHRLCSMPVNKDSLRLV